MRRENECSAIINFGKVLDAYLNSSEGYTQTEWMVDMLNDQIEVGCVALWYDKCKKVLCYGNHSIDFGWIKKCVQDDERMAICNELSKIGRALNDYAIDHMCEGTIYIETLNETVLKNERDRLYDMYFSVTYKDCWDEQTYM